MILLPKPPTGLLLLRNMSFLRLVVGGDAQKECWLHLGSPEPWSQKNNDPVPSTVSREC